MDHKLQLRQNGAISKQKQQCITKIFLIAWLTLFGVAQINALEPVSTANNIGINLRWSNSDYSEDRMFTDVMKTVRIWSCAVDANGWPTEDGNVIVWHGIANMYGTYKLSFECSNTNATVIANWCGMTLSNKGVNGNTVTYDMLVGDNGKGGFNLEFKNTNGGVRNVKMMRPIIPGSTTSYPAGTLFTNEIKILVGKFSTIRFMDYFAINGSCLTTWSQRPLPTDASQAQAQQRINTTAVGGCMEYAVMLCNETGCDMWLNVPLKANDDYITKMAQLLKYGSDGLNPYTSTQVNPIYPPLNLNIKVYVEYSNEIWNTAYGFSQGNENHDLAVAEVNAGNSPLNFGNSDNTWYWASRRVGKKTVEISNLFRAVFGDAAMMTKIRPVLESQLGYIELALTQSIMLIDQIYGNQTQWCSNPHPVSYYIYGGGGSAYYGAPSDRNDLTIDNIWTTGYMVAETFKNGLRKDAAMIKAFGLKRIAYEGGPSLDVSGNSDAVKKAAVSDPRMKANTIDMFDNGWSATGGDLLVYYASTGDYQWGFTEDIFNLNTPKYQAIDQLNTQPKAVATICPVPPATLKGIDYEYYWAVAGYGYPLDNSLHTAPNSYIIYMFRVETAGTYNVGANIGETVTLVLDGVTRGTQTGTNTDIPTYTMANLQPGLHTIMFKSVAGTCINSVTIKPGAGQISTSAKLVNANTNGGEGFSIYPNPAADFVSIVCNNQLINNNATIKLTDLSGRIVYSGLVSESSSMIMTNSFARGIYMVTLSDGSKSYSQKLILK